MSDPTKVYTEDELRAMTREQVQEVAAALSLETKGHTGTVINRILVAQGGQADAALEGTGEDTGSAIDAAAQTPAAPAPESLVQKAEHVAEEVVQEVEHVVEKVVEEVKHFIYRTKSGQPLSLGGQVFAPETHSVGEHPILEGYVGGAYMTKEEVPAPEAAPAADASEQK